MKKSELNNKMGEETPVEVVRKAISLHRELYEWSKAEQHRRKFQDYSAFISDLIRKDMEGQDVLPSLKAALETVRNLTATPSTPLPSFPSGRVAKSPSGGHGRPTPQSESDQYPEGTK